MRRRAAVVAALLASVLAAAPAHAKPGDIDAGYGLNGVAILPGGDRYQAQDSPLVATDGKHTVAGLLRNASDRVFLTRLTANGAVDTSFGAGDLHTNTVAAGRRAATAITSDGRILVAGAGESAGKITIERFSPAGIAEARFTVNVGGSYARPTAIHSIAGGKALLSIATDSGGGPAFMVARVTATGLDTGFGVLGKARVAFAGKPAQANDIEVLSSGQILVVGSAGAEGTAASDTAIARLNTNGALDTAGFGTAGTTVRDASGAGAADHAVAVAADATGIAITGPASGGGYVARLGTAGAYDPAFGIAGVQRSGLAAPMTGAPGAFLVPADVIFDHEGRVVATGTTKSNSSATALNRWTVVRLARTGASPLDTAFGSVGRATVTACDNNAGFGPTGLERQGTRIVVLGSCGAGGAVATARLLNVQPLPQGATLSVDPRSQAAGRRAVRLSQVDPSKVLGVVETLQGSAIRNSAIRNSAIRNSAIRNSALRNSAIRNSAIRNSAIRNSPILDIAIRNSSWAEILEGYLDVPLQNVTLGQVFDLEPAPPKLDALTLADIDLNTTAIRNSSIAALLLEPRPLDSIAAPAGGWCELIEDQPFNCTNGVDPATTSLLTLEIKGDVLPYSTPISLDGSDLGTGAALAELGRIKLVDANLAATPFGAVLASQIGALLACGSSCTGTLAERQAADPDGFSTATLGDLIARLPLPSLPDVTLGQVLGGLVPADAIPYERAPLDTLLAPADLRTTDVQRYRTAFALDCDQAAGLEVAAELPAGARIVPGSASFTVNGGAPRAVADAQPDSDFGGLPAFSLPNACSGLASGSSADVAFGFDVEPGYVLGPVIAKVQVATASSGAPVSAGDDALVDDSLDVGEADEGQPLSDDKIVTGHISSDTDIDDYTFTAPAGTTVTVSLSQLPADYDLFVFGPDLGPLADSAIRNSAIRNSAIRNSSTPDGALEPAADPQTLAPDSVQDLAIRNSAIRNSAIRNSSIRRGSADESATVVLRGSDAGQTFTVRVAGYNGASHREPYVLRMVSTPPGPTLPCAPVESLQGGTPGTFPQLPLADDRESLILVNRRRYAALYGEEAASRMISAATGFANHDKVKGVVIAVESDPTADVDATAAAWDSDPCSVDAVNDYAGTIAAVVDHARAGLPRLKHITLVGPDRVLPQFRVPDLAVIANERDYADELTAGGKDNAYSRALREAYMLSDDPHGDFDPKARQGSALYIPDVAVGRVVETAGEIEAQFAAFASANGVLDPQSGFVTGYDFISDGAHAIADALAPAVPGGATRLISETWTAEQALAGFNRTAAQFTSVNAHYDHYRGLPAAAFNGSDPNLFSSAQVAAAPGSVAFTIGCHSGLNVPASTLTLASENDPRQLDFVQKMAQRGALYAANTGFGYGDTETVAYSERLMTNFAALLASRDVTAGQALMFAKQRYAETLGTGDDYDAKALQIAQLSGLPQYRIGAAGGAGDAVLPSGGSGSGPGIRTEVRTLAPEFDEITGDRGRHWVVRGQDPLVVQRRPIQPRTVVDVTAADGWRVHGAVPEAMTTTEIDGVDPVYPVPAVDASAQSPEPDADRVIFPAYLSAAQTVGTPDGLRDRLEVVPGQFRDDPDTHDGSGSQTLVTSVRFRVLRSNSSDFTAPSVLRVDGTIVNGGVVFNIDVDADDARGGTVLYRTDADSGWRTIDIAPTAARRLGGAAVLPEGATVVDSAIATVHDDAGNSGTGRLKARGYSAQKQPPPGPGDPRFELTPGAPPSGFYTSSPSIALDKGDHAAATFEVSQDGGAYTPYTGSFTITGPLEGGHLVRARGSDGSTAALVFAIDNAAPAVTAFATTSPNANGWYRTNPVVAFACADATSGIVSCPDARTVTSEGRNQTISGSATDRAGNSGSGSTTVSVDKTAPTVTVTRPFGGVLIAALDQRLTGTVGDNLSGVVIDSVMVTYTPEGGEPLDPVKADVTGCNASRTSGCNWSAPPPPSLGNWSATATAYDDADNKGSSQETFFSVG